ncbi:hypothetical protein AtubIFM54640_003302 [Aspergillus tubingensis]|nr:hypothetical protein AtubIFM54640_003302 [Aspergillus tubingensis]
MALDNGNIEGRIYVEGCSQNVEKAPKGLVAPKYMGTVRDQRDMSALGRVQVLRRNFRFISILGFGCTLISTWEVILTLLTSGLTDGGTAGLIWGFIIVTAGFALVFASIAEMASIYHGIFDLIQHIPSQESPYG